MTGVITMRLSLDIWIAPHTTQTISNFNVYQYIRRCTYHLLKLFHIVLILLLSIYLRLVQQYTIKVQGGSNMTRTICV